MQSMRNELEDLAFRSLMPEAYKLIVARLEAMKAKNGAIIARIAAEPTDVATAAPRPRLPAPAPPS